MKWPTHMVAAAGIVFDSRGNVLIGKHPRRGWDLTGGQIENGENLEEGVLREIMEESGVTASVRCLAGVYSNVRPLPSCDGLPPIPTILHFAFICDYVSGDLTPSDETLEVIWTPKERALDYIAPPISRLRYEHALEYEGRARYCAYEMEPSFRVLFSRFI